MTSVGKPRSSRPSARRVVGGVVTLLACLTVLFYNVFSFNVRPTSVQWVRPYASEATQLTVVVIDGKRFQVTSVDVEESPSTVTVTVLGRDPGIPGPRAGIGYMHDAEVQLKDPIGTRSLVDQSGTPIPEEP